MKFFLLLASIVSLTPVVMAATQPVPSECSAEVNAPLLKFLHERGSRSGSQMNNVMVCGVAIASSYGIPKTESESGSHQVTLIAVKTPEDKTVTIEVISSDDKVGLVHASGGDVVFAYGQAFVPSSDELRPGNFHPVLGIQQTHCTNNSHLDDGWIMVNHTQFPTTPCPVRKHK